MLHEAGYRGEDIGVKENVAEALRTVAALGPPKLATATANGAAGVVTVNEDEMRWDASEGGSGANI